MSIITFSEFGEVMPQADASSTACRRVRALPARMPGAKGRGPRCGAIEPSRVSLIDALVGRRASAAPRALVVLSALALLLMPVASATAGPSVGELLAACERGLAQGNVGVDSALCEWYAVPCDCKLSRPKAELEPWCMPADESIDAAMLAMIDELKRAPDRRLPAEQVVPGMLSRLYPCAP